MPDLQFKGKEFVYNHHLSVPFRPLIADTSKSIIEKGQAARLDGNLVIHGDNLHALKALLPMYAGKVDCIFIDPPYNTGNEGWCYSDNVSAPYIKEWLDSNPVNKDDMLRHDKWLTMMYPRLRLLHELLANSGSFWMTLDDNEIHRAKIILDEIFGEENFIGHIAWQKMDSPRGTEQALSTYHDHVIVYSKSSLDVELQQQLRESILDAYPLQLEDGRRARRRQLRKNGANARREDRPTMWYPLTTPDGTEILPYSPDGWEGRWSLSLNEWNKRQADGMTAWIDRDGTWTPYYIEIAPATPKAAWSTIWCDIDGNRQAKSELTAIFGKDVDFATPKPKALIERILEIASDKDALVLDSFAGSGTTAHAVMQLNAEDGGERKFILVEGEDYADRLTAERVRRVMNGYEFAGKQRKELLREPLSFTAFKNSHKIMAQIDAIENLHGHEFDKITKAIKDDVLVVVGEMDIKDRVNGLGGTFTYCTLGDPIDLKGLLSGERLPAFEQIGGWLYNTATNEAFNPSNSNSNEFYLGESSGYNVWLYYKPDLDFLKSRDAALTLQRAEEIAAKKPFDKTGKRNLVFAPAKFAPNKALHALGVEYAPLPFALFKIDR